MTPICAFTEKALLVLRQQHEHLFYLKLEVADRTFTVVLRPLTLLEADSLAKSGPLIPPFELNEWVCDQCVLHLTGWPHSWGGGDFGAYLKSEAPAALADLVADQVIQISGFTDPENYSTLLEQYRVETQTLQVAMESFICSAFPGTKPREVQNMSIYEQMKMLARAEILLGKQLDLTPADKKRGPGHRLSSEAADMLSEGAADIPDPRKDNASLGPMLTGPERMGVGP